MGVNKQMRGKKKQTNSNPLIFQVGKFDVDISPIIHCSYISKKFMDHPSKQDLLN